MSSPSRACDGRQLLDPLQGRHPALDRDLRAASRGTSGPRSLDAPPSLFSVVPENVTKERTNKNVNHVATADDSDGMAAGG